MTIHELLKKVDLPPLEAELLLAFVLKKERIFLMSHPELSFSPKKIRSFLNLVKKRKSHWPLAYLLGQQGFYDLILEVNKNVLIPRPETEMMVDILQTELKEIKALDKEKIELIDLGTGSGAIIIALSKALRKNQANLFKKINFWGLDIKSAALKIAQKNANSYQLQKKINFIKSNLLKNFPKNHLTNTHLIIAANLPYLTPKETRSEKSLKNEPKSALIAGKDGLKYYHELLKDLKNKSFKSLILIMEINPQQKNNLQKLIKQYLPTGKILIQKDLRKQTRFILLKTKNQTTSTKN